MAKFKPPQHRGIAAKSQKCDESSSTEVIVLPSTNNTELYYSTVTKHAMWTANPYSVIPSSVGTPKFSDTSYTIRESKKKLFSVRFAE
jgi:hypothetical protein